MRKIWAPLGYKPAAKDADNGTEQGITNKEEPAKHERETKEEIPVAVAEQPEVAPVAEQVSEPASEPVVAEQSPEAPAA